MAKTFLGRQSYPLTKQSPILMANTTDALTFVAWSEEAEGMNCFICGKENAEDDIEGHDNICKICDFKWEYDYEGSKGEGYYLISDEEEKEEYDPRFSSHEAFNEWLTDELDLYDLLNEWDEFIEIKEKWCIENNHEIKEDGVYNMNIK